ncbi:MAG TPA: NADH-dependent [FeFe] hydrogenase, group A6 [Candidatus Wallbacteria bacterium]|nr:NADH-dependent [FeFe] hydrogenase, group A6 [Candidatus Wallbacteria bacterium]
MNENLIYVDGREVKIENEKNLLEIIRKANIEVPTFCYHSDLSVYGACRLCMVDVEGRGLSPSCSTPPEAGMKIKTNTGEIREIRKTIVELLLANHESNCPSCPKSTACQLQSLSKKLGVGEIKFKKLETKQPVDRSTESIVRDPNKCVLCGDCVRVCSEVQGVGVIDFAHRGSKVSVLPSFGKNLNDVECVLCGQCVRVCPTGALSVKSQINEVFKALNDKNKKVVAQIAPAVRVALGEMFGYEPGSVVTGQIVGALKHMGFNKVFDTSFTADLTVIEEANEFLTRFNKNENLPLITSCCPGWVKYAEQYYPQILPHLSSCKSPQQMFGSLAKDFLAKLYNVEPKDLVVVSIMPCTAKKFEAEREEFKHNGIAEVDHVISTYELAQMIEESGLNFKKIQPESFDMPFGFKTGAGIIFGNSGGVTEAVLRYVDEKLTNKKSDAYEYKIVRSGNGIKEFCAEINGIKINMAVVNGLANAKKAVESVKKGEKNYHFIEIMACPGGCIGGGGQPAPKEAGANAMRTQGLYDNDKMLQLHKPQQNPYIEELYKNHLGTPGSEKPHKLLHTKYHSRRRITEEGLSLINSKNARKIEVSVCVGTSCYIRGAQDLLHRLIKYIEDKEMTSIVEVKASFCFENCSKGPTVNVGGKIINRCDFETACKEIDLQAGKISDGSAA